MGCVGIDEVSNFSDVSEVVLARLTQLFNMMFHIQSRIKIKTKISNNFIGRNGQTFPYKIQLI